MENLTWDSMQEQSNEILTCGLNRLKKEPISALIDVRREVGNYLISLDKDPYYIGESKELSKRLKQQFTPATSTFYKNYQKWCKKNSHENPVAIDEFSIQFMSTRIGRKEIEEFGIVNLPTKINAFQLEKREKCVIPDKKGLWDTIQCNFSKLLKEGGSKILESKSISWVDINPINIAGLYLVKDEFNGLIYIGESSNIGKRIATHSSNTYFSALRRHVGTKIHNFELQEKKGRKRYFSDSEDETITEFLKKCKVTTFPVAFGRCELEEYLIRECNPLLNKKGNKC